MSIEYTFYFDVAKPPEQIVASLMTSDDGIRLQSLVDENSIKLYSDRVDHPVVQADIDETFGFAPTVDVSFVLDKFHQDHAGLEMEVVRSLVDLLSRQEGDAVLIFSGGPPLFKRTNGELWLNEKWSSWKTNAPEGLKLNYHLACL